jgi:endoglucanase
MPKSSGSCIARRGSPRREFRLAACALVASLLTADATSAKRINTSHVVGRGVNVLESDPLWENKPSRFKAADFAAIRAAGFQTVRVNLTVFRLMDKQGNLPKSWFTALDYVIESATENGLNVILDEHDSITCAQDAAACRYYLLRFWTQLSSHLKRAPDNVYFEILNEPNGAVTPDIWNSLLRDCLRVIRTHHPSRLVIVGPAHWNSWANLSSLKLPRDANLIITIHYYDPHTFTHQGAEWSRVAKHISGVGWGTTADYKKLKQDFNAIERWSALHRREIIIGEFGAYERADDASRVRYAAAVARLSEGKGWGWCWWQFTGDFALFDRTRGWNYEILQALLHRDVRSTQLMQHEQETVLAGTATSSEVRP